MRRKSVSFPIDKIKCTTFVRRELSEDRVFQFMELYKSTEDEIPPLVVEEGTYELRDGRHRREALKRLGKKTVSVEFVEPLPKPEFLMAAFGNVR